MMEIVAGKGLQDPIDRDLPQFGVGQWPRALVRWDPSVQRQVKPTQRQICSQRRLRIGGSLLSYPSCAVIRLDDIALDRECETDAIAPADLVVCQVEDELSRRPFPRGVGSGPATRVPTPHERSDSGGSRCQERQRILRTHEICVGKRREHEANIMAPNCRPASLAPPTTPGILLPPRATHASFPLARAARRPSLLDPGRRAPRSAVDRIAELDPARLRRLQGVGTLSGFAAGAWLGAAEAPTKLVTLGIPPVVISFMMVIGVFLARWSLPALLLGILWGTLLFNELRDAGAARWLGVWGGAAAMFAGATLLAIASSAQAPGGNALRGVAAALAAGALWGTMYIPYRKAYLTGMHPLSFVAFFTIGELGMMTALALSVSGGPGPLWGELAKSREVLFWLLLAGFVWVVGDLFQQYAAKYVGISRGIPLSNTNQLWGLVWGIAVFGELGGGSPALYWRVIGGSLLMAAGAGAIALASAPSREHRRWQEAGARESNRYGVDPAYVAAGMAGEDARGPRAANRRGPLDWLLVAGATAVFVGFAAVARVPALLVDWRWAAALTLALVAFLTAGGLALWRATRFG